MDYCRIDTEDNVAVALKDLHKGSEVCGVRLLEDIPSGHKFALKDIPEGECAVKYGFPIGRLTKAAGAGSLVDHNSLRSSLSDRSEYSYNPCASARPAPDGVTGGRTFRGFIRWNGDVGVRNQIWVIPTVGCVNGIVNELALRFSKEIEDRGGSVDAVVPFPHNYGCSQLGGDHENTRKILADLLHHPNCGGALVVSLGCENNQLEALLDEAGNYDKERIRTMKVQEVDGDELEYGLSLLRQLFSIASTDVRGEVPVSKLKVGLKCGGSDGLSGITANPLLGRFSDWLVAEGGTAVLTEVPEMFGAETILMDRCCNGDIFDKTVRLINGFKDYFTSNGQPVYENPSPGNKAGGISTLEEKSLGCIRKGGSSPVVDVVDYAGLIKTKGLNLLSSPGNDIVSSTALAASGCQIILFTTGRGTPLGSFVPTVKVSSNTPLAERKPSWIDFDAGVLTGGRDIEEVREVFINTVLEIADGRLSKSELNNSREMAIFKSGVTL